MIDYIQNMSPQYFLAQIVGLMALAGGIITYSQRDDHKLKEWSVIQAMVMSAHFILLEAYVAGGSALVSGIRNFLSTRMNAKKLVPFFLLAYAASGYFRYQVWFDILPMLGSMGSTIGLFYLRRIPMRMTFLFSTTMWLVHNFLAGSLGTTIMEGFIWLANARMIYHLYRHDITRTPKVAID